MQTLGETISYYRKANAMTQEQLAEKCSVTAQAVSKWENDLTAPDISLLPKLAELFHCTVDGLLGVKHAEVVAVDPESVDLAKILLRIHVISKKGDRVNVNLPLSIAEVLLKNEKLADGMTGGNAHWLKDIDLGQVVALVRMGAMGKLVEVESANGDQVEIWVE